MTGRPRNDSLRADDSSYAHKFSKNETHSVILHLIWLLFIPYTWITLSKYRYDFQNYNFNLCNRSIKPTGCESRILPVITAVTYRLRYCKFIWNRRFLYWQEIWLTRLKSYDKKSQNFQNFEVNFKNYFFSRFCGRI